MDKDVIAQQNVTGHDDVLEDCAQLAAGHGYLRPDDDYKRGYTDASKAISSSIRARVGSAPAPHPLVDVVTDLCRALQFYVDRAPVEKPDVRDEDGSWHRFGNYDDVADDAVALDRWDAAQTAIAMLARFSPPIPGSERATSEHRELAKALHVLADFHTRDDHEMGFLVERTRKPDEFLRWSNREYIDAWKIVREFIHLPTKPA